MKILLISSSPRKKESYTFSLAKEVLGGCACEGAESETLHLCDLKIDFCHSCEACHKKIMSCPLDDDVGMILEKMLEADGIILASPNYINLVTASMKAIFERASHFIHCQRLLGKYIAGVVTSGSGRDEQVLDYIKLCANACAAQYVGGLASIGQEICGKKEDAFELGKKIVLDIKEKKLFPEQVRVIERFKEHFKNLITMRKLDWPDEYKYWQDKCWL